jgi:hypothetical protein
VSVNLNCRRVPFGHIECVGNDTETRLNDGWVGIADGKIVFRPDRGSLGYGLYSTKEQVLRHTGCLEAMRVSLRLRMFTEEENAEESVTP